jgi:hypothetical protein
MSQGKTLSVKLISVLLRENTFKMNEVLQGVPHDVCSF